MRTSLEERLAARPALLADGATGTNYFAMGLTSGEPPERWNVERPDLVADLHRRFVDAGADIILTNTFGCNRNRLALHGLQGRVGELAEAAAKIAGDVAAAATVPVVVAGSVGPTGELFEPLGALTHADAVEAFGEQIAGLVAGGADVVWIETMSAPDELRAAAEAAASAGVPYTVTCSFDTAGRTMMGLAPAELVDVVAEVRPGPSALGANCGVGAPDVLVSLLELAEAEGSTPLICKGNCGVPRFEGTDVVYSGTPELMARYTTLAIDAGARIVGGCCGTTPAHLAAMRAAIDVHRRGDRPDRQRIVGEVGELVNVAPGVAVAAPRRPRRRAS